MRTLTKLACVSFLSLLSACGTPSDGYYDANGNYVPYNRYNSEDHAHSPLPGGTRDQYEPARTDYGVVRYDRAGYYDSNGYYITVDNGPNVPTSMFPPRGMCRVWFPERAAIDQPRIESCDGIRSRVPAGAYVIYGG